MTTKTFSIQMIISATATVEASSLKEAKEIAMGMLPEHLSEYDRQVILHEDITPEVKKIIKGKGSY